MHVDFHLTECMWWVWEPSQHPTVCSPPQRSALAYAVHARATCNQPMKNITKNPLPKKTNHPTTKWEDILISLQLCQRIRQGGKTWMQKEGEQQEALEMPWLQGAGSISKCCSLQDSWRPSSTGPGQLPEKELLRVASAQGWIVQLVAKCFLSVFFHFPLLLSQFSSLLYFDFWPSLPTIFCPTP